MMSEFSGQQGREFAVMLATLAAAQAKNPPLLPAAATFMCHCHKYVRLVPGHFFRDETIGCEVQDVVCPQCRPTFRDQIRVVCARCRTVSSTCVPGHDPKLAFTFKPGSILHTPVCAGCVPALATLKPAPSVPFVELLIHVCQREGKNYREEIQAWWTSLRASLPPQDAEALPLQVADWARRR